MDSRILPFLRAPVACLFKRPLDLDVDDLGHAPFWPVLHFLFSIQYLTFNPRAKFEVCIFIRSRNIRGSRNLKSRSTHQGHAPSVHFLANVRYMLSSVRLSVCRLSSVCLSSVTFVRPTQGIEIFGNVSTTFRTLAICELSVKILRRS